MMTIDRKDLRTSIEFSLEQLEIIYLRIYNHGQTDSDKVMNILNKLAERMSFLGEDKYIKMTRDLMEGKK